MTVELEPGLRRLTAPNPSPMTKDGTNTYLLGRDAIAVIDPGPDSAAHLANILAAAGDVPITQIFVTHAHLDHSPLAGPLSEATGAPVLAFGDAEAGRSDAMLGLDHIGGGEGVHREFVPDRELADGEGVDAGDRRIEAIWTPGHFGNHMTFLSGDFAFCGDLVMGWSSSLVSPPDGDISHFKASCRRLRARGPRVLHSGHGAPIEDPRERIDWLIAHREARERQIVEALDQKPGSAMDLARRIYTDIPPAMLGAAARNVLAHLIDLQNRGRATTDGTVSETSQFRAT